MQYVRIVGILGKSDIEYGGQGENLCPFILCKYILTFWNAERGGVRLSPRTGRPKAEKPKNVDVKVRFDEGNHEKLLQYCKSHNMTRTEAIRKAVDLLVKSEK